MHTRILNVKFYETLRLCELFTYILFIIESFTAWWVLLIFMMYQPKEMKQIGVLILFKLSVSHYYVLSVFMQNLQLPPVTTSSYC